MSENPPDDIARISDQTRYAVAQWASRPVSRLPAANAQHTQPEVIDVLVHIEPEADSTPAGRAGTGPADRADLEAEIARLVGPERRPCAPPTRLCVDDPVQAEVFVAIEQTADIGTCAALDRSSGRVMEGHPLLNSISIHGRAAPE